MPALELHRAAPLSTSARAATPLSTIEVEETEFLLSFASALHDYGAAAHRIETSVMDLAEVFGVRAHIAMSPTVLTLALGELGSQRTSMLRLGNGDHNLSKLCAVDELASKVADRELSPAQAFYELEAIRNRPNTYGTPLRIAAAVTVCAAAVVFLGGGLVDSVVAACIGLLSSLLALVFERYQPGRGVFELLAAFIAGALSFGAAAAGAPVNIQIAMVAGIIVLVPGLTLTTAMFEIASGHLVAGTSRLTAVAVVFLEILLGVALAEATVGRLVDPAGVVAGPMFPAWAEGVALVVAAFSASVLLRVPPPKLRASVLVAIVSFYGAKLGIAEFSSELGALVGGLTAATLSNLYARYRRTPALVALVPALLLLVPGTLGFRSLSSLWQADVVGGIDTAFQMIVVAMSLVMGMLVGHSIVPPRRRL